MCASLPFIQCQLGVGWGISTTDRKIDILETVHKKTQRQLSTFLGFWFVLRLNVPVNNFSVISGRSHRFLGN